MGHLLTNDKKKYFVWFKSIERNDFDMKLVKLQNSGKMYYGTKTKMKRDFFCMKPLEEAIHKRSKNTTGEPVNWLKKNPIKVSYKKFLEVDTELKILDLLQCRGRSRDFNKIRFTSLYKIVRPISIPKYKGIMELLRYEYFNNLTHNPNEKK